MTYIELLDGEWDDINHKITKEDKLRLKEIDELSKAIIDKAIVGFATTTSGSVNVRELVRNWCLLKDREQKLNQLGL